MVLLFFSSLLACTPDGEGIDCDLEATPEGLTQAELRTLGEVATGLVNDDRAFFAEESSGAQPLALSDAASEVARCHARDMCERQYFDHVNPEGELVDARIDRTLGYTFGVDYSAAGENLALYADGVTTGSTEVPALGDTVMTTHHLGYMDECRCLGDCPSGKLSGHRMNVLHPLWDEVGIGEWYCEDDGAFYNVQIFWRRAPLTTTAYPYCDDGNTGDPPVPFSTAAP